MWQLYIIATGGSYIATGGQLYCSHRWTAILNSDTILHWPNLLINSKRGSKNMNFLRFQILKKLTCNYKVIVKVNYIQLLEKKHK